MHMISHRPPPIQCGLCILADALLLLQCEKVLLLKCKELKAEKLFCNLLIVMYSLISFSELDFVFIYNNQYNLVEKHTQTYTNTHTHIYIYIWIFHMFQTPLYG